MRTTAGSSAPNATADEATDEEAKAEHATTRKTVTKETDYPSQSCPLGTPTHGESPTAIPTEERRGMKKDGERRGEEKREHNKRNAMVFGDNVRARMAARALPRTPTQKGRGR